MGLSRAFTQQPTTQNSVAANQYPNSATITDMVNMTATPIVVPARAGNRRGMIIENDGTTPVIFGYNTTVNSSNRTALLFPNDVWEDLSGWQGPVSIASTANGGAANFTEMVFI